MNLISPAWTGQILYVLSKSPLRFTEIADTIGTVSRKVLTQRLHLMEKEGMIVRRPGDKGAQMLYELTPFGRSVMPVIEQLMKWSETKPSN